MKDKEWLKKQIRDLETEESENFPHDLLISRYDILCLIDLLEEPKKPEVPQFVANDIYLCQIQKGTLVDAMYSAKGKVKKWIDLNGSEMYARAWLDGYEIEKEKLYEIIMPHSQEVLAHWVEEDEWEFMYREAISGNSDWKFQFNEEEIKGIDPRYWSFAEPVEEEAEFYSEYEEREME